MSGYPIPDTAAAKTLGFALRSVRYSESAVHELLGEDAYSSGEEEAPAEERRLPESRLATDFAVGANPDQLVWRLLAVLNRAFLAVGGEPLRFELRPEDVPDFMRPTGWNVSEVLTAPQMHDRYLSKTSFPVPPATPGAFVARALR